MEGWRSDLRLRIALGLILALGWSGGACAQRWERLGPEGGTVISLGASSGGELYLGTADGHVFASKNEARSWELRGRVGSRLDAVVTRLVIDPRSGKRLFAAVWFQEAGAGGGVFRSEDEGRSWELAGLRGEAVRVLEIAPSRPEELVAGTRSGVFRSTDQGKSWARISPPGDQEIRNVDSLAIDPRDSRVIFVGTFHLPWLTRDGGKTWKAVTAGIIDDSDIMSLRVDAANPERVYMSACSGIYRSGNQGGQWTKLQGIPYAARRTQVIVQDPGKPETLYAGTTEGLWVTRDQGENWTRTTSSDWVVNSVVVLPESAGRPGRVVLGLEGQGIQVSDDAGMSFTEANRGFKHVIVKQLLADYNMTGHFLMIVERNSSEILESRDAGRSWARMSLKSQDSGKAPALKTEQVEEVYASPWGWLLRLGNGHLWRWEENKGAWKEWKLRLPMAMAATGRTDQAGKSSGVRRLLAGQMIAFSQRLAVVSTKAGLVSCQESGICSQLKAYGRGAPVRAGWLSSSGREMGVIMDGKLGWSSDGGETAVWRDLPVAGEQALWLDITNSGSQISVYLGTGSGLFLSNDAGIHWQRAEGGLPTGQVERGLRSSRSWVLTERDGGIYVSRDGGSTWSRVDQDAERCRFTGLVDAGDGRFLVGSQSEGLLRLDLAGEQGVSGKH